ncbi:hypothetical protein GGI23_003575, partial [Coemansia sp. RSA 2559]
MTESPEASRKRQRVGRRPRYSGSSTQPMTTRSQTQTPRLPGEAPATDTKPLGKRKTKSAAVLQANIAEGRHVGALSDVEASDTEDIDPGQKDVILTSRYIQELAGEQELVAKLGLVFSDPCILARSFPQLNPELAASCPVDVEDVRRAYGYMKDKAPNKAMHDLQLLTASAVAMLSLDPCDEHDNQMSAVLIILLNPSIADYAHDDGTYLLPELCSVILNQPSEQKSLLMRYFAAADNSAQDNHSSRDRTENDCMSFTHYANIFQSFVTRETNRAARNTASQPLSTSEPASKKVCLHSLSGCSLALVVQCLALMNSYNNTHGIVSHSVFYNDSVNEHIDTKEEVPRFRMPKGVSFCSYPFLLSPTTKSEIIRIESMIHMRTELQDSFFRAMFSGVTCPYLVLEVRRDSLVRDTLYQLDLKMSQDLRKQLKVRFVGEEGVDEGGVQK